MVGKSSSSSKKAAATLEEAPEAAAPEAAAEAPAAEAAAEEAPTEETPAEENKEDAKKTDEKPEKKKKPKKKVVPSWATLDDSTRSKLAKAGSLPKPKVQDALLDAIKLCADSKGAASASAIRSMVMSDNPDLPKMVLKKAMAKAVERGLVVQSKGKGFAGSFKLGKGKPLKKAEGEKGKKGKKDAGPAKAPLEELFPLVFTWACNPKEASVGLIKKYLVANYPELDLGEDSKHYRRALEAAEKHGSLERITGKGFNGTFALVDGASKTGGKFDDAFENALIAMNEPKDLSVGAATCATNSISTYIFTCTCTCVSTCTCTCISAFFHLSLHLYFHLYFPRCPSCVTTSPATTPSTTRTTGPTCSSPRSTGR